MTALTGAQRIAAVRWLGQVARGADDPAAGASEDAGRPAHTLRDLQRPGDPPARRLTAPSAARTTPRRSREERIDDLARAGALIAAEIDRLQHGEQRRYA